MPIIGISCRFCLDRIYLLYIVYYYVNASRTRAARWQCFDWRLTKRQGIKVKPNELVKGRKGTKQNRNVPEKLQVMMGK